MVRGRLALATIAALGALGVLSGGAAAAAAAAAPPLSTGDLSWWWERPAPQGEDVTSLAAAPPSSAWALAGDAILTSADGGLTWATRRHRVDGERLRALAAAPGPGVWAVGDGGLILHLGAVGAAWTAQDSGTGADLLGAAAAAGGSAWAVGAGGTILGTTDGGTHWAAQSSPVSTALTCVSFAGPDDGWAAGPGGVVLHTGNGGGGWQTQDTGLGTGDLHAVAALDATHAVVAGAGGALATTGDGGSSWQSQATDPGTTFRALAFSGTDHGVAVGSSFDGLTYRPVVLVTTDGGAHWTGGAQAPLATKALAAAWSSAGCLAGGDAGGLAIAADPSAAWTSLTQPEPGSPGASDPISRIDFVNATDGWAAGGASLLTTGDGGHTWAPPAAQPGFAPDGLDAATGQCVWVTGDDGRVAATGDGGVTWVQTTPAPGVALHAIAAPAMTGAWAVGDGGTIVATDDDGSSWTPEAAGTTADLRAIAAADALDALAVGDGGTIVATTDGHDWQPQTSGTTEDLTAVDWGGSATAWAVGAAGVVLRTTDGGAVWHAQDPGLTGDLTGVAATDALHAWITGPSGTLARTTDGGDHWARVDAGTSRDLLAVSAPAPGQAWIAGAGGAVLAYDGDPPWVTPLGVDGRWHRTTVTIMLDGGDTISGVAGLSWSLDSLPWQQGPAVTVPADPVAHLTDGWNVVVYTATDAAGNVCPTGYLTVAIDTRKPSTHALATVTARRGAVVALPYRVTDVAPNGGTARTTIRLTTWSGRPVKTLRCGTLPANVSHRCAFRCRLAPGAYRYLVRATDPAGNPQSHTGVGRLYVR